jgi:hypothetical protein
MVGWELYCVCKGQRERYKVGGEDLPLAGYTRLPRAIRSSLLGYQ